jgi:hypothetical protein
MTRSLDLGVRPRIKYESQSGLRPTKEGMSLTSVLRIEYGLLFCQQWVRAGQKRPSPRFDRKDTPEHIAFYISYKRRHLNTLPW